MEIDAQPSGLGFLDDRLVVASMLDRRVMQYDGAELSVIADLAQHVDGPLNDLLVDADGGIYVGSFGFEAEATEIRPTSLLRLDSAGAPTVVMDDVIFPNGMAITPDGGTLYLAETFAYRISAFDRAPDGTLSNRRVWAQFGTTPSTTTAHIMEVDAICPDGIWLDAEGALWVADARGSGALRLVEGEIVDQIPVSPGTAVFALTLGGQTADVVHVLRSRSRQGEHQNERNGTVLMCDVEVPGAAFSRKP